MAPLPYYLGVDAGNSKTLALVARADGLVQGWGRGGVGDIYVSEAAAKTAVAQAVTQALAMAGVTHEDLSRTCLSLAGADWPEDFALWQDEAERQGYGKRVLIVNDALGALRGGTAESGVAIVCGSGAAVGARHREKQWHSSFWHEPMGGFELGDKVLRAVCRSELNLGPTTVLTDMVLRYCDVRCVEEALHKLTARRASSDRVGVGLSRLLLDAAALGDDVALTEVTSAGRVLADYAWVGAVRVGLVDKPFPLILTGGVLRHESSLLHEAITHYAALKMPAARTQRATYEPVVGALLLAIESGETATLNDHALLRSSLPSAEYYAT